MYRSASSHMKGESVIGRNVLLLAKLRVVERLSYKLNFATTTHKLNLVHLIYKSVVKNQMIELTIFCEVVLA